MATISSRLAPIREILTSPYVPRLLSASLVGRLPTGMAALAILLTVRAHGGTYTLAGVLSAIYAASSAIGGPLLGRLIDRTRQPPNPHRLWPDLGGSLRRDRNDRSSGSADHDHGPDHRSRRGHPTVGTLPARAVVAHAA
ncbi:hypothetical protein [Allosaccharopolyspora coralli]|uniref:hypothetical protein n=1 Tax=Allosaccharopolyspora coralli TaxID=2665642 RepID=UPI0016525800|nr:hypothetical protein [Allosaccharopolyspora coralli]